MSNNFVPLKICQLKEKSAQVEIIKENLAIISKRLRDSGASYVSIVAVMGAYRTGKSFLLDLMMRYMRQRSAMMEKARKDEEALQGKIDELEEQGEEAEAGAARETLAQMKEAHKVKHEPRDQSWHFGDENAFKQKPPSWLLEGDAAKIFEGSLKDANAGGFAWRPGKDKCTQGIWLWSTPFVFTDEAGRKIGVLLMDTQGAWDDTMTKAQSATIFGLTSLLSSKLIYNVQNRIEEVQMENLDYITTFAQTVCSDLPGSGSPYGHLEILIRDWANYEDGFSEAQCKGQMKDHEDDHMSPEKVPEDAKPRVERLASCFRSINTFGLPHPGLKVTKPGYEGEIAHLDPDFLHLLDAFVDQFFGGDFPKPCAPLGREITVNNFQQVVMNFAEAFQENAEAMAIGLREAFVKVEMRACEEELLSRFKQQLNYHAPEGSVVDPVVLKTEVDKMLITFKDDFESKLKPWKLKDSEHHQAVQTFSKSIEDIANLRTIRNDQQVEGATMKIVASPVVGCAAYFLLVHHFILYVVAAAGGYLHAKKWSTRNHVEMYDPSVMQGIVEDVKKWGVNRYQDIQAIQVAIHRFNPHEAMDGLMKASQQAGTMAQAAVRGASVQQLMASQGNTGAASSSSGAK
mmetsp:Transcript_50909/g.108105  ORF Transcript_50909/g.108105 Transcript_50909/m.108105 type:complete len:629 (-) Transcript_50909:114-2000(-)|eukprot:CAMPEP_0206493690 /NCGR_PEP_ID=MMETSP0324_2-20121206/47176_1 /ASSEMBLY_ACC=CAM_ASM_000836 /TAXON_ID=2866 /ORGANISM="Crypthecodinium cohnii, Strain Seligo" /LENGTH=628 /DNA_ID=CAMNT_0053976989 /DNA_START=530 /DNA_END=2416 /DNA_ORIENTATION=+